MLHKYLNDLVYLADVDKLISYYLYGLKMNNAKQIIKNYWDFKIPVKINLISKSLGIELIKISEDIDYDSELKIIDGKPFVFYKGNLNITKERFLYCSSNRTLCFK